MNTNHRVIPPALDTQIARWLALIGWMALIFYLSAQSTLPSAEDPWLDFLFKKAAHFSGYAVLAVLFWRALPAGRLLWAWSWLLSVVYACSDEFHQSFVQNRHPAARDVVIDACGAATALLVIWHVQRRRRASEELAPAQLER